MVIINRQLNRPPLVSKGVSTPTTAGTGIADPTNAWNLNSGIKLLLYGQSGSGKTTFWATFPGPTLALICSGGNKPGELRSIDTPENRKKITAKVITSIEQLRGEIAGAGSYATVVLDHVTGFADLIIKELLGLEEVPVGKSRIAGKGESWSLVSQQQYGQMTIIAKEVLVKLLTLPGNVVVIGQERVFGGKEDAVQSDLIKPTVGVAVTPSLAGWLNPACDYVMQIFKRPLMVAQPQITLQGKLQPVTYARGKGVEYCARCEPHEVYMTKFRKPGGKALPEVIVLGNSVDGVDPVGGYAKMMAVIQGK